MVVDILTKYAHFLALAHPYTKKWPHFSSKRWSSYMVFPHPFFQIGTGFLLVLSGLELFKLVGTKLKMSSAYAHKLMARWRW